MTLYKLGDHAPKCEGEGHFVAENATLIGQVLLKNHASVWFNAVIRADNAQITLGERTNVQDGAVLHTDPGLPLVLGDDVTVGHNAMLHGCEVGSNTLVGIGAVVLNRAKIGRNCIVGANALITEGMEIPDNSLVVGSPAKVIRTLGEDVASMLSESANIYVRHAKRYRDSLEEVSKLEVVE
ncbi:gamma carbonic anhydrase family protein [Simiduia sp. 21SJ11W-1]|uniref:gamma carbonic anhydrase family protein n=1 Tax=Simiduia sp. 21SJ11W-1 TaxID=2909669 RepID=UPI00209CAE5A|nr:gamma carbonic anhydrase family protein [Simiduia sp. 21SJ11W-1]UTA46318.1 gamma carbonic anhydrase family protein [Simiduia sp. 21SJ11W-1]